MSNAPKDIEALLEEAIASALPELDSATADSPEYAKTVEHIDRLNKMLLAHRELNHKIEIAKSELDLKMVDSVKKKPMFNPDTLLTVGANLAGILLILNFERANVVASKALGLIVKAR